MGVFVPPVPRSCPQPGTWLSHLDVDAVAPLGGGALAVLVAGAAILLQPQHLAPAPPTLLVLPLQLVQGPALSALLQPTVAVLGGHCLGPTQQPMVLQQLLQTGRAQALGSHSPTGGCVVTSCYGLLGAK